MNTQHNTNDNYGDIWDTRGLTFLGYWALRQHQFGHGLLIFHATAFGVKVGNILHFKWSVFKKEITNEYVYFDYNPIELETGNGEKLVFNFHIIKQCEIVFNAIIKHNQNFSHDDFMYTNSKTGKVLTTSTLRRELKTLYKKTKDKVFKMTGQELAYREIETNVFEIVWGREMVNYYRFAKQAFIKVSKRMGHRTLKDTIALLEFEIMEDIDLKFDFYSETAYVALSSLIDKEIDVKELEHQLSGVKFIYNGNIHNTKRFPFRITESL
jgi:hypothetical protein